MKTSELTGALLDAWVARANGWECNGNLSAWVDDKGVVQFIPAACYDPSHDWSLGGPIIERAGMGIVKFYEPTDGPIPDGFEWCALIRDDSLRMDGPTPLIAAMRLHVAGKFGKELPDAIS